MLLASASLGQQFSSENVADQVVAASPVPVQSKRILGIIPNNRTSPSLKTTNLSQLRKNLRIARQDSFDRVTVVLAAARLTLSSPKRVRRLGKA